MSLAPITNKAPAYSLGIGNLLGVKGQVAELVDAIEICVIKGNSKRVYIKHVQVRILS